MSLYVSDFLDGRIEEIVQNLRKTNSEYAFAAEKNRILYDKIDGVINECAYLKEFLDHEFTKTALTQQKLYEQGYLDCVKLMRMLGLI